MSDNAESIPHSPTPGKDPPAAASSEHPESSPKPQPSISIAEEGTDTGSKEKEKDKNKMAPPPRRPSSNRPKPQIITTQPSFSSRASLSNSRLPSRSHSYLTSQNLTQTQIQSQSQLPEEIPRPPFSPFFTLINDNGGEKQGGHTIHPHKIHYIFSDDDVSDLLTSSLITSLNPGTASSSPEASRELSSSQRGSSSESSATYKKKVREGKAEKRDREDRVVIVDIDEKGTGVKAVSSLSSTWQVLSAEISNAPTFEVGSSTEEQEGRERGLMLRIEGVGVSTLVTNEEEKGERKESKGEGSMVMGEEEMSGLIEGFERKMGVLRRVLERGKEISFPGGDGIHEEEEVEQQGQGGRRVSEGEFGSG